MKGKPYYEKDRAYRAYCNSQKRLDTAIAKGAPRARIERLMATNQRLLERYRLAIANHKPIPGDPFSS